MAMRQKTYFVNVRSHEERARLDKRGNNYIEANGFKGGKSYDYQKFCEALFQVLYNAPTGIIGSLKILEDLYTTSGIDGTEVAWNNGFGIFELLLTSEQFKHVVKREEMFVPWSFVYSASNSDEMHYYWKNQPRHNFDADRDGFNPVYIDPILRIPDKEEAKKLFDDLSKPPRSQSEMNNGNRIYGCYLPPKVPPKKAVRVEGPIISYNIYEPVVAGEEDNHPQQ